MTHDQWLERVRFGPDGLVPVVAQERLAGTVLMLAWANREALARTLATGQAHYWSRSRQAPWRKGESSGHTQRVAEIRLDCDADTVLYRVDQAGPACHTGQATCFSTVVGPDGALSEEPDPGAHLLTRLATTIAARAEERPAGSYTSSLLTSGVPKVSQKVGEEAVEVVVAANAEDAGRLAAESADLFYHLLVLFRAKGVELQDVLRELDARRR
ncbi:MAG TPA: bifunctional phosphoribosyl-AMP cyclohydrolase/phosphoribosyl-ATP diphosphatase HisIE [Gemmatimonadales bacterium]|nr:bifunctional phosphoribosyl-AMP cyclohydrolase/phosphoribosyl-ATP diphosphatase HisIE [Gemmatimonadales bacterium]